MYSIKPYRPWKTSVGVICSPSGFCCVPRPRGATQNSPGPAIANQTVSTQHSGLSAHTHTFAGLTVSAQAIPAPHQCIWHARHTPPRVATIGTRSLPTIYQAAALEPPPSPMLLACILWRYTMIDSHSTHKQRANACKGGACAPPHDLHDHI